MNVGALWSKAGERYVGFWGTLIVHNDMSAEPRKFASNLLFGSTIVCILALSLVFGLQPWLILGGTAVLLLLVHVAAYVYLLLGANSRASKVEEVLPDFLSLVASNIRAGLTPDKALIMSARPEFGPLATAIMSAGKNSITGMPIDQVMLGIGERIRSDVLDNTVTLIVEGLHSGGDMAELLEKSSFDLRKFRSVKKEVNSIVLNYVLFIVAAVTFGAPLLYGISTFLMDIMMTIRKRVGSGIEGDTASMGQGINIFKGKLTLSSDAVTIFAAAAIIITVFFGCMAIGVMTSGKREDGLKYFPVLAFIGLGILLGVKFGLAALLGPLMGGS